MEHGNNGPNFINEPQAVLEQMLGRQLTQEEVYMPGHFHITVDNINDYLSLASQYSFIQIKKPKTREMFGWDAVLIFPNSKTLTLWEERWK